MMKTEQPSIYPLDDVDTAILRLLNHNARVSSRDIGKKVKKSPVTVIKRIKAMETAGVISKYSVVIDHERLGYDILVIIELMISKGKLLQVEKRIASHQGVVGLYDHTGDFDATIIARFKNRRSMDSFLKKIQTFDFVERTRTKLILNTIKEKWNSI